MSEGQVEGDFRVGGAHTDGIKVFGDLGTCLVCGGTDIIDDQLTLQLCCQDCGWEITALRPSSDNKFQDYQDVRVNGDQKKTRILLETIKKYEGLHRDEIITLSTQYVDRKKIREPEKVAEVLISYKTRIFFVNMNGDNVKSERSELARIEERGNAKCRCDKSQMSIIKKIHTETVDSQIVLNEIAFLAFDIFEIGENKPSGETQRVVDLAQRQIPYFMKLIFGDDETRGIKYLCRLDQFLFVITFLVLCRLQQDLHFGQLLKKGVSLIGQRTFTKISSQLKVILNFVEKKCLLKSIEPKIFTFVQQHLQGFKKFLQEIQIVEKNQTLYGYINTFFAIFFILHHAHNDVLYSLYQKRPTRVREGAKIPVCKRFKEIDYTKYDTKIIEQQLKPFIIQHVKFEQSSQELEIDQIFCSSFELRQVCKMIVCIIHNDRERQFAQVQPLDI